MIIKRNIPGLVGLYLAGAVFVLAAALALVAGFLPLEGAAAGFDRGAYKNVDYGDVHSYDPYIFRKQWVNRPENRGLLISLGETRVEPVVEAALGEGTWWVGFISGEAPVAGLELVVTAAANSRAVFDAPPEALSGYDAMTFTQTAGRAEWLSYLKPLPAAESAVVLNAIPPMPSGRLKDASQHDITGAIGYFAGDDGESITLQVQSVSELDVLLLAIVTDEGKVVAEFPANATLEAASASAHHWLTTFTAARTGGDYPLAKLFLRYRYIGKDGSTDPREVKTSGIIPFKPYDDAVYNGTEIRTQDNLALFAFVRQNGDTVRFEGSYIKLDRMLFVPQGKRLVLEAGQTIDLSGDATIFCRDAITVNGTAEAPVRVISTDGTGDGLVVSQANDGLGRSEVNYLICDGLDEVHSGIYALTGAVTFYESDVDFYGCQFRNNKSEDGLNIVRSDATLRSCEWSNTYQDAFDSDFSTGLFDDCYFELTGNDALDVSGSAYTITNCRFQNIHDKCLSIGEQSTATIENIYADTAQAILGVKDLSEVHARNLTGKDVFIGYLAYQKKPEFGHSAAYIENLTLTGTKDFDYLIQEDEIYYLDGRRIFPKGKKKEALIIEKIINEEPIQ
ncbi:MAG: right-handed parallel beta-helix repeat-containing protein [Peptococcaceae bacterium]|jgi:hypothetical protein|nr:right-handed parallel beta-helix repeat-containing protein [Peptococcaceae bacterium]